MRKSLWSVVKDQAAEDGETEKSSKRLPVRIPANRMLFPAGSKTKVLATQTKTVRREPVRVEITPQVRKYVRRNIIQEIGPKSPGELTSAVAKKFAKYAPVQQTLGTAKTPGRTVPIAQRESMHIRTGVADTVAIVSAAAQTEVAAFPSWLPWARIEAPRAPILLPSKKPSAETIRAADAFIALSQRPLDLDKSALASVSSDVKDIPVVSASKSTTGQKTKVPTTQMTKISPQNTTRTRNRGNASNVTTNVPFLIINLAKEESDTTACNYTVSNEQLIEPQSSSKSQSMPILSATAIEPSKSSPMLESMRKSLAKVIESPRRPSFRESEIPSVAKDSSFPSPSPSILSPAPEADLAEVRRLLAEVSVLEEEKSQRMAKIAHLTGRAERKLGPTLMEQPPYKRPLGLPNGTVEMVQTEMPAQDCDSGLPQLALASTLTTPDLPHTQMEVEQPEVLLVKNSGLGMAKPALFSFQKANKLPSAGLEVHLPKNPLEEPQILLTKKPKVTNQGQIMVETPMQELGVLLAERHSSRLEDRRFKQGATMPSGSDKPGRSRLVNTRAMTKQKDDLAAYLQLESTTPISESPIRANSVTPADSRRRSRAKTPTPVVPGRGRPRRSRSPVVSGRKARVSQSPTPGFSGRGRPIRAKSAAPAKTPTPVISRRGRPRRSQSPTTLVVSGRPSRSITQTPDVSRRGRPRRSQSPTPVVSGKGRPRRSLSPAPLVSGRPRRSKTQTPDVSGRGREYCSQSPTPVGRGRARQTQSLMPEVYGRGRPRRSKTQTPDVSRRVQPYPQYPLPVGSGRGSARKSQSPMPVSSGRGRARHSQSPTPVGPKRGRPSQAKSTALEVSERPSSKTATKADLNSHKKRPANNVGVSSAKRARTTSEGPQLEVSSSAVFPAHLKARKPFVESWAGDSPLATPLDATVMDEKTVNASCLATIANESTFEMSQKDCMTKLRGDGEEAQISAKEQFHPSVVAPVSPGRIQASINKTYQLAATEHSYSLPPWAAHSLVADYHSYSEESPNQIPDKSNTQASPMPSLVSPMGRKDAKSTKENETSSHIFLASPEKTETSGQVSPTKTGSSTPSISESPRTTASNQLREGNWTTLSPKSFQIPVVSLERLSAFSLSPDFSQSYHEYMDPNVQPRPPKLAELDLLMNSPLYKVLSRPPNATVTPRQRTTAKSIRKPSSPTPLTTRRAWRPSDLIKCKAVDKVATARKSILKNPFKSKYNSPARTPESLLPPPVASAKKLDVTEEKAKKPIGRKSLVQYQKLRKTFPKLMMTPENTPVSRSRIDARALDSAAKTSRNVQAMLELLEDS